MTLVVKTAFGSSRRVAEPIVTETGMTDADFREFLVSVLQRHTPEIMKTV